MSLPSRFVKMAGGGNDFLIFEADGRALADEDRARLALVCRRGLSVGADGALFLSPGEKGRVRVDYYNADGGAAMFCANGTRCAARYAVRHGLAAGGSAVLETGWGQIEARVEDASVTLALPAVPAPQDPIPISGRGLPPTAIPMKVGVPHLVVFVRGDLGKFPIDRFGPPLRRHPALPEGANVNFVRAAGENRIEVRSWERGVEGETLSCGSGVVAAAIAAGRQGMAVSPVTCGTKSGVDLVVEFREEGDVVAGVRLTGDAREIYGGELLEEAWKA
ncbi:MAG TPA: diaminopimelate epimerase [Thermoanaerobaculia bacterium]|jgi:diaminopimelate epimerase|nr:diaminopimelate epimerase [Thermoanaerobaculia bacterium]